MTDNTIVLLCSLAVWSLRGVGLHTAFIGITQRVLVILSNVLHSLSFVCWCGYLLVRWLLCAHHIWRQRRTSSAGSKDGTYTKRQKCDERMHATWLTNSWRDLGKGTASYLPVSSRSWPNMLKKSHSMVLAYQGKWPRFATNSWNSHEICQKRLNRKRTYWGDNKEEQCGSQETRTRWSTCVVVVCAAVFGASTRGLHTPSVHCRQGVVLYDSPIAANHTRAWSSGSREEIIILRHPGIKYDL